MALFQQDGGVMMKMVVTDNMFLGQGSDTLAPLYKISFKKKYTQ